MKKFVKHVLYLTMISFLIGYIYVNKEDVKNMVATIEIYSKAITITEYEYTEEFDINNIKVNTNNYYYKKLSDNQKTIYHSLANGIRELNKEIILKNYEYTDRQTSLEDVELVFSYFCLDHPEVFYLNNSYTVSTVNSVLGSKITIEVSYSVESIDDLNAKVNKINDVIDSYLEDVEGKSQMEAEIILHDNLAKNVVYYEYSDVENVPANCHTIEGAFLNHSAVCDGLSKALQVLLSNAGMKNIIVLGKLEAAPHAWNMVKLDDKWYNLDITSNKSIQLDLEENTVIHTYFNVSDEIINKTHTFDNKELLPVSENLNGRYNYYIYTNKYISSEDNVKVKLKTIIEDNEDKDILEFYTENTNNIQSNIYNTIISANKTEYLKDRQFSYYNILNTYIVLKNRN